MDLRASAANCSVTCIRTCDHIDPDVELSLSLISTKIDPPIQKIDLLVNPQKYVTPRRPSTDKTKRHTASEL